MNIVLQHVCVWLLFFFIFLFTIPYLPMSSIPGVLFALLCFADWPRVREMFFTYRREVCLIAAALFVGLVFSHLPGKSFKGVYDFLRGAILFFPVLYLVRHHSARLLSAMPWASCAAVVYLWVAVFFSQKGALLHWGMMRSKFSMLSGHYNVYSTAAAVICLATLVSLLSLPRGSNRLPLAAASVAGLLLTIYSGSRGSFLALVTAITWCLFLKFPKWRNLIIATGLFFVVAVGALIYSNQAGELMDSWQRKGNLNSGRMSIHTAVISATWQNAPATGFGPNTFKYLDYGQIYRRNLSLPHSVYLESFYSLGLIGTGLLVTTFGSLLFRLRERRKPELFLLLGATLTAFFLLRGLVDFKLFGPFYTGSLAAAFGFMLGNLEPSTGQGEGSFVSTEGGRRAVFLDRDGTINIEKSYLCKMEDFEFIHGAPEAIKRFKDAGYLVIVVSNQSGVGRGYFDEQSVETLHSHIQAELAVYGTSIDAFYYCPHHPEKGVGDYKLNCDCRKGNPGMLLQAAKEHDIELQQSFMIGDKLADIEAGERAGCTSLLVLTGYGEDSASKSDVESVKKCLDLDSAARLILDQRFATQGR